MTDAGLASVPVRASSTTGETASGFFYFRTFFRGGATLLLRGMRQAATGKELFYFEIPLDKQTSER